MEHPLPDGTKILADISCSHCNLGYAGDDTIVENVQPTSIINHTIRDDVIRYKVTDLPISQFILVEHIKEVLSE